MFLKSLTLKGFKSFADPTTMALEPGVTVVVGPNGSGKSNVVDAIAWVLGAQAPKSVRSQKMDDVIFAGTATRPALGRAEVILTIDNSAGLLPVEFSEVTVSRILFRTGESEYAINGVACRLLDVQELLSDAGVGRQQHVIVSQGQIDAVLNARPEDRRAIVEEAAGVLKYRRRKEKAERRLDATEANLMRVQDLLREVRRQLRPLERQAEAATRHGELVSELTALKIHVAGREIAGLRSKLQALAADDSEVRRLEAELKGELARLDSTVMAVESQLTACGESDIGDRLMRVEQLRERARGLAAVLAERRRSMERDRGQLLDSDLVANLEADAARLRAELTAVVLEVDRMGPEVEQLDLEEATLAAQREASAEASDDDPSRIRAVTAAAEVRGELRSMRALVERSESDLRSTVERTRLLRQRAAALDADTERLRADCADCEVVETGLVADVRQAEGRRHDAERRLAVAMQARAEVAEVVSRFSARVEALQHALDLARERAGAERLAGVVGALGSLLDLIEIDAEWQITVEAALGEALGGVVVDGPEAARRALAALRDSSTSGAVLTVGVPPAASVASPVGEPVRPHVRTSHHGVAVLLDALIGNAVLVEADVAIETAIAHPDLIVVTATGDRFSGGCWRIGTASGGTTRAALERAREEAAAADQHLLASEQAARSTQEQLDAAQLAEAHLAELLDANDSRFNAASEALARVQSERREVSAEIASLDRGAQALTEHIAAERERITALDAVLPALTADERAAADAATALNRTRADLDARAAALASHRREFEVRAAGFHERRQLLELRLAETEQRLAADAGARDLAGSRRAAIEQAFAVVEQLVGVAASRREVIEVEHARLTDQRRRQSEEVRALAARLDGYRRARVEAERQLEQVRERAHRLDIGAAETRLRLETAIENVRRDLDIEPGIAEAAAAPPVPDGATPAGRARELERELRLLGPINPLALEEYTELLQRHTFLEEQLEDVRSTRRDLGRIIRAVDQEIQSVFASAYADVSANFTQLFATLFPGGQGTLPLTEPHDLLATGIEIEAKPSGKNVKKLSLLSGGERSLTALAFLFAVFRSRPSPFYVMDEVEAALDDINLHRFLGLVAEFRKEAQLLIVSHQKRTMEAGDSLLGVSMQPGGSSKVITERVSASV